MKTTTPATRGERFRAARLGAGYTQVELALKTDIDQSHISLVENDRAELSIDRWITISKVLLVSLDDLLAD